MKKIFEYFGLICLICFSFFITEKTTMVVQEVDEIMITIKSEMSNYEVASVDAKITDNTIVPGLLGKSVNISKSYQNMKEKGLYDNSFYIYDAILPNVSITDNSDKYIVNGNQEKKMVSLIFIVDNKSIVDVQNVVGSTPVSFVINSTNIDLEINNIIATNKLDNEIVISTNSEEDYTLLNRKLESIDIKVNYCYNDNQNTNFLELCYEDGKYSIYTDTIISSSPLKTVKKELKSGSLLVFKITDDVLNELPNIISYINSRGFTITTLTNHLSENW